MNDDIADAPAQHPTPKRHVFETTDLEVGRAFMNAAYGTSLRMRGNGQEQLVRHSRCDLGLFCLDDVTLSMETEYDSDPLDRLAVIQLGSKGHLDAKEFATRCAVLATKTCVPAALRAAYVSFLTARLRTRHWLPAVVA